jgi:hypothetical protein
MSAKREMTGRKASGRKTSGGQCLSDGGCGVRHGEALPHGRRAATAEKGGSNHV